MSISRNMVALLNGDIVTNTKLIVNTSQLRWLDLTEELDIRLSDQEKREMARDIHDVQKNIPCRLEMILSSSLTPSGRRFRSLFSPLERKRLSKGILLEQIPFVPYFKSNVGLQDRAESYVTYLKMVHDNMPYIDAFKDKFARTTPIYSWRKKAIFNGCLLYRKLVESGVIEKGEHINLDEMLSERRDLLALIGCHLDGKEMSVKEQANAMRQMVNDALVSANRVEKTQSEEDVATKTAVEQHENKEENVTETTPVQKRTKQKMPRKRFGFVTFAQGVTDKLKPLKAVLRGHRRIVLINENKNEKLAFDEETIRIMKNNPELANLIVEKQLKMNQIIANRKWTLREIGKTFLGRSDLDKLDREYDQKFDELSRQQDAAKGENKDGVLQKFMHKVQEMRKKTVSLAQHVGKTILVKGKTLLTRKKKMTLVQPVETNELPAQPVVSSTHVAPRIVDSILQNKAQVRAEDRSVEEVPDLSKLGEPERVIAALDPIVDALRVKSELTDHEMGEIALISHLINAYGSENSNLGYVNNLFVGDRFQLEVAQSLVAKLKQQGFDVPMKRRSIKNNRASQVKIHKWRVSLEQRNRQCLPQAEKIA